jgi:hypothetical protein
MKENGGHRPTWRLVVAACAVVAVAAVIGVTSAAGHGGRKSGTINVLLKNSVFEIVNNNGDKNIGDSFAFNAEIWDANGGDHPIGHFDGACTATTADDSRAVCTDVFSLDGRGEITTTGVDPISGVPDVDPIVGGDGEFQTARGEVHLGDVNGAVITATLILRR